MLLLLLLLLLLSSVLLPVLFRLRVLISLLLGHARAERGTRALPLAENLALAEILPRPRALQQRNTAEGRAVRRALRRRYGGLCQLQWDGRLRGRGVRQHDRRPEAAQGTFKM